MVRPVANSYDRCVRTNVENIDVNLAKRQHREYCTTLKKLGVTLLWVERADTLPDSCFVEDTAVIVGETAVICNMRVPSRVPEVTPVTRLLDGLKEIHYITPPATIDGGDVLQIEDRVFVGISPRTNLHAVAQLRELLGQNNVEIIPVTVHNTTHLKSVCTSLGSHHILYTKGYFDPKLLRDYTRIVVPSTEKYAANCLAINGTVLMAKGYPMTKQRIETEGFTVEELEMSEFRKGEGALTCLSIIL